MSKKQEEAMAAALARYEQDRIDHPEDYYSEEETMERMNTMIRACAFQPPRDEREAEVRRQVSRDMEHGAEMDAKDPNWRKRRP